VSTFYFTPPVFFYFQTGKVSHRFDKNNQSIFTDKVKIIQQNFSLLRNIYKDIQGKRQNKTVQMYNTKYHL